MPDPELPLATALENLCRAVLAYDAALERYGTLGESWIRGAPELDRLWQTCVDLARAFSTSTTQP